MEACIRSLPDIGVSSNSMRLVVLPALLVSAVHLMRLSCKRQPEFYAKMIFSGTG
jgi:hypothetical protein